MRNPARSFFLLAVSLVVFASCAHAQVPTFPDYSGWPLIASTSAKAVLNGQQLNLDVRGYENKDLKNLRWHNVNIIANSQGSSWLAGWVEQIGEQHPDGSITTKEVHIYLFENKNGKWTFIKDFSSSKHPGGPIAELREFITSQYKLEFQP